MPNNIIRVKLAVLAIVLMVLVKPAICKDNVSKTKGDPGVGKTSVVQMFTSDGREFPKNYNMTFGIDLYLKRHTLPDSKNTMEVLVYDCAGLDIYTDCLKHCWDHVDAVLFVYDVTTPSSLQSVSDWTQLVGSGPAPRALFGNKTDLGHRRVVAEMTARQLAEKMQMQYFEGSAKGFSGVQEAFSWLVQQMHQESSQSDTGVRPSYNTLHKSVLRSSLSNSSLK